MPLSLEVKRRLWLVREFSMTALFACFSALLMCWMAASILQLLMLGFTFPIWWLAMLTVTAVVTCLVVATRRYAIVPWWELYLVPAWMSVRYLPLSDMEIDRFMTLIGVLLLISAALCFYIQLHRSIKRIECSPGHIAATFR